MAITITLVASFPNRLRYLCVNSGSPLGGTATIPNDAGATPDLQTDTLALPGTSWLWQIARARINGIGTVAAGALTQAQSRAILMEDGTTSVGNANVPRARTMISPRTGAAVWAVDANVDGAGDPTLNVASSAVAGDAYIDVLVAGQAPAS